MDYNEAYTMLKAAEMLMTEVDLTLYEWQTDLDFMSFIGVNATVELWTNDDPPRIITKDVLSQAAGKELRVMHFIPGEGRVQVGTATVDKNGKLVASLEREVPELRTSMNFSVRMPSFTNPPFEGLNKPLTIHGLEEGIAKDEERMHARREWLKLTDTKIENHPFFKE